MIGEGNVDGNLMDSMNGRVSMIVGDGRGAIRGVSIMIGNGGGSISGVDERGMIVMGDGRGMMVVGDGKFSTLAISHDVIR